MPFPLELFLEGNIIGKPKRALDKDNMCRA
jgi:hypothetical protein